MLTAGCLEAASPQRQAESATDGLQATGRLGGQRVAISSGEPEVRSGDCDPDDGADDDLCMRVRTIDGAQVEFVIENPDRLAPGERVPVVDPACPQAGCDEVTDGVVIEVDSEGTRRRAVGGSLLVRRVDERVAAEFDLALRGSDRLSGSFDVRVP